MKRMQLTTTRLLMALCLLLAGNISASGATKIDSYGAETEQWLVKLDSVLLNREQYEQDKLDFINKLKAHRETLTTPVDIYKANCKIYNVCKTFNAELAVDAVEYNLEYARKINDADKITEWKINKSFMLSVTGMLLEANDVIKDIQGQTLSHELQVMYYSQMVYLHAHFGQYIGDGPMHDQYVHDENAFRDTLVAILQPTDKDYIWFCACKAMSDGKADSASVALERILNGKNVERSQRESAINCYALALMYKSLGMNDRYIQNLTKSAITDIRSANKDMASLEELAGVIYEQRIAGKEFGGPFSGNSQDLTRANNYINVCMAVGQDFNNRVRIVSISRVKDKIQNAYIERDIQQRKALKFYLWLALGLMVTVMVAVAFIIRSYRKREKLYVELAEVNDKLRAVNDALAESNYVKEEYIGYVFSLCSSYISKIDEYRKNVNRKLTVKQYDELRTMTDKSMVQEELQTFYQNFDAIFLHIYPDFVADFNSLLDPEKRIEPKKGELLNTDLRIYALVRLGINDSVKIAELLHCSPQTIYNNRLKIRSRAIVPKEKFVEAIQQLGKK